MGTSLNLELGTAGVPNLAVDPVDEPGGNVGVQKDEGHDVQAEVLKVVEVSRGGLEVFRPLRLGDVLQEPDGVVDGVVALQGHEVRHLVDVPLVAARISNIGGFINS